MNCSPQQNVIKVFYFDTKTVTDTCSRQKALLSSDNIINIITLSCFIVYTSDRVVGTNISVREIRDSIPQVANKIFSLGWRQVSGKITQLIFSHYSSCSYKNPFLTPQHVKKLIFVVC